MQLEAVAEAASLQTRRETVRVVKFRQKGYPRDSCLCLVAKSAYPEMFASEVSELSVGGDTVPYRWNSFSLQWRPKNRLSSPRKKPPS